MERTQEAQKNLFFGTFNFSRRAWLMLALLAALPNALGLIVIPTGLGFNFHFFQIAVFLAAFAFGPFGGALSGAFGSVYAAMLMHNPWIIFGNVLLGFFAGYFAQKKIFGTRMPALAAVWLAFAVQLPWLWVSDIYLAQMPVPAVQGVIIALAVSNTVWAVAAAKLQKHLLRLARSTHN